MFSGGVSEDLGSWVTCGHFLSVIEDFSFKNSLTEPQMKELCLHKLPEYALEFFLKSKGNSKIAKQNCIKNGGYSKL